MIERDRWKDRWIDWFFVRKFFSASPFCTVDRGRGEEEEEARCCGACLDSGVRMAEEFHRRPHHRAVGAD